MVDKLSNDRHILSNRKGLILEDILTVCLKRLELALVVGTLSYDRELGTFRYSL